MTRVALLPVVYAVMVHAANAQDPVFRSEVSLVHVDAEVMSPEGRVIEGLKKEDFRVFDNGKRQTVTAFSAAEGPLDLILLIDKSGSVASVTVKMVSAARLAINQLRKGDRVQVMTFDNDYRVIAPFTDDLDAVEQTVKSVIALPFGAPTLIRAAVDGAVMEFHGQKRTERRRAVLAVTDNMGLHSGDVHNIVNNYWEADALLSGLVLESPLAKAKAQDE